MKRQLAAVLTAVVMGLLLWSGLRRSGPDAPLTSEAARTTAANPGSGDPFETPDPYDGAEACVRSLLETAADGDIDVYLAAFTGPLRARLDREIAEQGREAFARELRAAAAARKGRAVFAPEPDGPDAARVVVETVYPDRNERQTFLVERSTKGSGWRVAGVELARTRQPTAPYGSMAAFGSPEGVPVPTDPDPATSPSETP